MAALSPSPLITREHTFQLPLGQKPNRPQGLMGLHSFEAEEPWQNRSRLCIVSGFLKFPSMEVINSYGPVKSTSVLPLFQRTKTVNAVLSGRNLDDLLCL